MTEQRATVIYDGECDACTRWAETLGRQSGASKFDIIPSNDTLVRDRFAMIPAADFSGSLQLVLADGTRLQGAAAIEQLTRIVPRWRWLSPLFRLPFARTFAAGVYRWVANHRQWL